MKPTPDNENMTVAIQLTDVQKVIDRISVINIANLQVEAGNISAIIGAIDSGNEVLFDLLIGKSQPTTGKIQLAGFDPAGDRDVFSCEVGMLFAQDKKFFVAAKFVD